ncbi:peroxisomal membrane protein PMP27 [Monosporozyma unispora]
MLGINSLIKSQFVTKSTKYLSKSVGREKMARLGQYTSQFIFLYTGSLLASQLQQHFKFLFKCLGLFKPLGSIQQVVLIEESWQFGSLMSWFNLFRVYSLFLWQVFDQYNILSLLSIVNSKSFHLSPIIPRLANYFWLSTLFWTVMVEFKKIVLYQQEISATHKILHNKKNQKNDVLITSTLTKKKHFCGERSASFRKMVASILDSFVVLKLLKLIDHYNLLIAFFGVVTSLWGIEDIWKAC